MIACINKKHPEYQRLKDASGLSDFLLEIYIRKHQNEFGEDSFPKLDQIPNADSEKYVNNLLKLNKDNTTSIRDILNITGTKSIEDAIIYLNNNYQDLNIQIIPLGKDAEVNITHRPSSHEYNLNDYNEGWDDSLNTGYKNSTVFLNESLNLLAKQFGIKINTITISELETEKWKDKVIDGRTTNAFIYDGDIYINTDVADLDAPMHEMMHIFIGALKFINPDLYQDLLNKIPGIENYQTLASKYKGRTQNDINEEILVTEYSKYLVGLDSALDFVNDNIVKEIFYQMDRVLDTILDGEISTRTIPRQEIISKNLKQVAQKVRSAALNLINYHGTIDKAQIHRMQTNTKQELMKKGLLTEYCL